MKQQLTVSIIIPTHNRCKTLNNLLHRLSLQTYPLALIEVIVVADGCKDRTIEMLKSYNAPYTLHYIEQQGQGAAVARNIGAGAAKNNVFLFLDDDIEPSMGLVEAHANAHSHSNKVVIGYLPFALPKNAGFFHLKLSAWWEDTFYLMRNPGYWHSFEDLMSGNFSISSVLFRQVGGFDAEFRCREDFELGARLIKAGADFSFCKEAWGIHRDEITDHTRSLKRKRLEGYADIRFVNLHPELIGRLWLAGLTKRAPFASLVLSLAYNLPSLSDLFAECMVLQLNLLEWFRMRSTWGRLSIKLHRYWYMRGVTDAVPSKKELQNYIKEKFKYLKDITKDQQDILEIDLEKGLSEAEQLLDDMRPNAVRFKFGNQLVGQINFWAGAERLRGVHLRLFLATKFSWPLMEAIAFNEKKSSRQEPLMLSELHSLTSVSE